MPTSMTSTPNDGLDLQAMHEQQMTIGDVGYRLDDHYMVFATQGPIEQEGPYAPPEAHADRFLFKLKVTHPVRSDERAILSDSGAEADG